MQMSINSLSVRYVNSFCCLSSPIHTKSFKESVNSSLFLKQKKKYAHTKTKNPQSIKNKGVFGLELLRMSSHIYTHKRGESLLEKKKNKEEKEENRYDRSPYLSFGSSITQRIVKSFMEVCCLLLLVWYKHWAGSSPWNDTAIRDIASWSNFVICTLFANGVYI
jgi:hypothetical protein